MINNKTESSWRTKDIQRLLRENKKLKNTCEKLQQEKEELSSLNKKNTIAYESLLNTFMEEKKDKGSQMPLPEGTVLLYIGDEKELFPEETRSFILDSLREYVRNAEADRRRTHVLQSVLQANPESVIKEKRALLKQELKDFSGMNQEKKKKLESLGFVVVPTNGKQRHHKILYARDPRYHAVTSATGSDCRSGLNLAALLSKIAF